MGAAIVKGAYETVIVSHHNHRPGSYVIDVAVPGIRDVFLAAYPLPCVSPNGLSLSLGKFSAGVAGGRDRGVSEVSIILLEQGRGGRHFVFPENISHAVSRMSCRSLRL